MALTEVENLIKHNKHSRHTFGVHADVIPAVPVITGGQNGATETTSPWARPLFGTKPKDKT